MALRDPVTIIPAEEEATPDPDTDLSFDEFREKLRTAQEQGTVRVYRVPLDERNQPMGGKRQSELFTAPIDLYSYEELIAKTRREFLRPDQTVMAARFYGTRAGVRGVQFNKIVMIERPNTDDGLGKESLAGILKVIQESSERQQAFMQSFFERLTANAHAAPIIPTNPIEIAKGMIEAVSGLMAAVNKPLAALAAPVATPATSLKDMMESMILMRDLAQDFAGTGEKEDTAVGIARAVAQVAQPIANALADKSRASTVMELRRRALPAPKRPAPLPGNPPAAEPAAQVAQVTSSPVKKSATEEPDMLNQIRPHLDTLCDMAQDNPPADPQEVAGLVMDLVPDSFDDALWKLVSSPRFVKNLALLNKRVNEHAEFFEKVRAAIIAEFSEDDPGISDDAEPIVRNSAEEPGTPHG